MIELSLDIATSLVWIFCKKHYTKEFLLCLLFLLVMKFVLVLLVPEAVFPVFLFEQYDVDYVVFYR